MEMASSQPLPPSTRLQSSKHDPEHEELKGVISDIKALLSRIDSEIPLLQLAISASGESLSTSIPATISPSRLLQASTLLSVGDSQYSQSPQRSLQIGPLFNLSLYMLFVGHASGLTSRDKNEECGNSRRSRKCSQATDCSADDERRPIWQEVFHKARVRLCRTPCDVVTRAYAYHLEVVEDLDDGRVHDWDEESSVTLPEVGIKELIPIHQIVKIFYTDTGRILNIGDTQMENNPVLLLKRDVKAPEPAVNKTNALELRSYFGSDVGPEDGEASGGHATQPSGDGPRSNDATRAAEANGSSANGISSNLAKHLDPEWIALEVFDGSGDEVVEGSSDTEDDSATQTYLGSLDSPPGARQPARRQSFEDLESSRQQLRNDMDKLSLSPEPREPQQQSAAAPFANVTGSLSLIEMLIRLAGLQEFHQASHLSIPDHILTFFLEEASTTGLTGEAERRARDAAKHQVGFDPYTGSPSAEQ